MQLFLVNPVVEEYDTPDGWHVIKRANGACEAMKAVDVTTSATVTGQVFITPNISVDLPKGLFTEITLPIGTSGVTGCSFYRFSLSGVQSLQFNLWSNAQRSNVSGQVYLKIVGKWK